MNAELDRLEKEFGSATLLMIGCAPNLSGRKICLVGDITEIPGLAEVDIEIKQLDQQPFIGQRAASDRAKVFNLTLSSDCFLVDGVWSESEADRTREVLAKMIGAVANHRL